MAKVLPSAPLGRNEAPALLAGASWFLGTVQDMALYDIALVLVLLGFLVAAVSIYRNRHQTVEREDAPTEDEWMDAIR
jgi:hypothetical protein